MVLDPGFLNRIVNVSWGGKAVFVAADGDGNQLIGERKVDEHGNNKIEWTKQDPFHIAEDKDVDFIASSSYDVVGTDDEAKSVFLLIGHYNNTGPDVADTVISILMSPDGYNWKDNLTEKDVLRTDQFHPPPEVIERWPGASVWDDNDKAFYATAIEDKSLTGLGQVLRGERMYRSTDGLSWSLVGETYIPDSTQAEFWMRYPEPSMIKAHCVKEENQGGIPDGFHGYSKATKIIMAPKTPHEFRVLGIDFEGTPASEVKITRPPPAATGTGTVSMPCVCVAHGEGVWVAGGGSEGTFPFLDRTRVLDASFDDGESWQNTLNDTAARPINTVIGGKVVGTS